MRYLLLFIAAVFLSLNLSAQTNLVTNGSFENYTGACPTFAPNGYFTQVLNWRPNNSMPTHGYPSVDLYCGGPNYGNCAPGPVPAAGSSGPTYVGFHTRILSPQYNEGIWQQLATPLTAGENYVISFDLMTCQSGLFTDGPSDFCVYSNVDTLIPACPADNPSVQLLGCIPFDSLDNVNWKHHSFTFSAPANANVIAFSGGACFVSEVYYYLDNVVLVSDQATGISTDPEAFSFSASPSPFSDELNAEINSPEALDMKVYNISGQFIESIHINKGHSNTKLGESWKPGIYFIQMNGADTSFTKKVVKL